MKRLTFKITIDAPKEKIWDVLWNEETYSVWTAPFAEGSRAETDWKEGSQALFLSPNGDGMISKIKKSVPYDFMSIEHIGFIQNGVADTTSTAVKQWQGAMENYTLESSDGKTLLLIETDIAKDYIAMFGEAWPKALEIVKRLAEK